MPFFVSCGSSGGEDGNNGGVSNNEEEEFKAIISGSVELPAYVPAGRLWIEFEDLDTKDPLYEGPTEVDGSFSASMVVSKNQDKILIQVIAPENPEAMAMALLDLKGTASSSQIANKTLANNALDEKNLSVSVNSQTTAEIIVLRASGKLNDHMPSDLSADEMKIVEDIASDLEINGTQFCSTNYNPDENDSVTYEDHLKSLLTSRFSSVNIPPVRKDFDDILQSEGLQAARQEAYNTIWAGNRAIDGGFGWANVGVNRIRKSIKLAVPELTQDGFTEHEAYVMESSDLESIADIIMSEGYGNCRENAFVGAYIASRLKKFKQVAVMQIFKGGNIYDSSHAVALACEEGAETYDIVNWRFTTITNSQSPISTKILSANCTIIDPWKNETLPMDQFLDKYETHSINDLMPINLEDDSTRLLNRSTSNNQIQSRFIQFASVSDTRPECSFGSPPDACSVFVIPGEEICDNGIDDDKDNKTDCADPDCENDDACSSGGGPDSFSVTINIPGFPLSFDPWLVIGANDASFTGDIYIPNVPTISAFENSTSLSLEMFMLYFDPRQIDGPGNYNLQSMDQVFMEELGEATISYVDNEVKNVDDGTPVVFTSSGGTVSLTKYGENDGDRLVGTFSATISGDRVYDIDADENPLRSTVTGTMNGSFNVEVK